MNTPVASASPHGAERDHRFPAYGPIEAALGYVLCYVLVDRVTPAIVTVFGETVLDLSPSVVRDVVFFVAYTIAAHSLDRLVLGGIRTLASG